MSERTMMNVGGWTVIPDQNLLQRDGHSIKLEPRAIELLVYLARRPGRVVTAQDLMTDIWRGRIVEDSAIYKRINELRKAFGDDAREPRFIETIPKRGYRLVAPVTWSEHGSASAEGPRPHDAPTKPATDRHGRWAAYGLAGATALGLAFALLNRNEPTDPTTGDRSSAAAPRIRPLTVDGGLKERPRLSPNGELVAFAWNGPTNNFDVYVKATQGDARAINVTEHAAGDNAPVWSPDGDELAFVRNEAGRLSIHIASWPGRQTRKILDIAGAAGYANHRTATLSWSPGDRRFLAYAEKPSIDAPARIMRADLDTGDTLTLTTPVGANIIGDFDPAYSPDGKRIAFVRAPASYSTLDIWIMNSDGEGARRVTAGQWAFVHSLAWEPSGKGLLFTAGDLFSQRAYSVNPDEGMPRPLPGLGDNDRFANAQGGRVLYARYAMAPLRLWVMPGRNATDSSSAARDFGVEGAKLVFTRDGSRVAYIRGSGDGHVQIWTANQDGTAQQVLVDVKSDAFNPDWAPDGRQLLFNSLDSGNWDAYVIDTETRRVRQVTTHAADDYYPRFSRDGRSIYFSSNRTGRYEVYKTPAEGGRDEDAVLVTQAGGIDGVESHDGRYLFYERTQNADPSLLTDAPIWRLALDDSSDADEVLVGWSRPERGWVLAESGIYFLTREPNYRIRHLDFASNQITDVYRGTGQALYPSVSPDESSLFVAREEPRTSELWLIENLPQ